MIPAQLLLLTGAPATGKSWLARRLAQHYGACCCSKDEIKEQLFDVLGAGDAQWSRRLSDASFALLFRFAARLLAPRRILLLEGNFRPGEHEAALMAQLSGSAVALAQILCRADAATRAARLAARAADTTRHRGHRDQVPGAAAPGAAAPGAAAPGETEFLELPGPRWVFNSELPGEGSDDHEWLALCRHIDDWQAGRC
jgi:predicted kinase